MDLRRTTALAALVAAAALGGCSAEPAPAPVAAATGPATAPPSPQPPARPAPFPGARPAPPAATVSIPGTARQTHRGDALLLGRVRERTGAYTSYDVTWRARSTGPGARRGVLRESGVLNVPHGRGPFPAVVLAHGYIDPAIYESGLGMTRERAVLSEHGYLALHVDYRGHASSSPDPSGGTDVRLGYAVDVISAVDALRRADLPVADDRVAVFGRSMGGGVAQKVAAVAPGLTSAYVAWASVSSDDAENVEHFIRDAADPRLRALTLGPGLPDEAPRFWRGVSPRTYVGRITEPVLLVHGTRDETCPPRWSRRTYRAMRAAGVHAQLALYPDAHAFGPSFDAAMRRTLAFLDAHV